MASRESFGQRVARRSRIELGRVKRQLAATATPPKPAIVAAASCPAPDRAYGGRGSHQYASWQPAIPGSYRWFAQTFGRR